MRTAGRIRMEKRDPALLNHGQPLRHDRQQRDERFESTTSLIGSGCWHRLPMRVLDGGNGGGQQSGRGGCEAAPDQLSRPNERCVDEDTTCHGCLLRQQSTAPVMRVKWEGVMAHGLDRSDRSANHRHLTHQPGRSTSRSRGRGPRRSSASRRHHATKTRRWSRRHDLREPLSRRSGVSRNAPGTMSQ